MPFARSMVFGIGGAAGAAIFTWPLTYLIYGRGQTFYHDVSRDSFSIWGWLSLGAGFALTGIYSLVWTMLYDISGACVIFFDFLHRLEDIFNCR